MRKPPGLGGFLGDFDDLEAKAGVRASKAG